MSGFLRLDPGLDEQFDENALFSSSQLSDVVQSSPFVRPNVTLQVRPEVSSRIRPDVSSHVRPEISSQVRPEISSQVRPEMSSQVRPEMSSQVRPVKSPDVSSLVSPSVTFNTSVSSNVSSLVCPSVTSNISASSIVSSVDRQSVTSSVCPIVTSCNNVSSNVSLHVTSHVSQYVPSHVSSIVSPSVTSNVSQIVSSHVSQNVSSDDSQIVSSHDSSNLSHVSYSSSLDPNHFFARSDVENVDPLDPIANMGDVNDSEGSNLAQVNATRVETVGVANTDADDQHGHVLEDGADVQEAAREEQDADDVQPLPGTSGQADSSNEGKWLSYSELMLDSYPAKSKIVYLKAYKMFERYLKSKKQFVPNVAPSEIQILNYFHYLKHEKKMAPTTLWSTYSRVNACVKRLFGFSLKNFVRVSDVLKSYESGYKVKKASIFSPQEVRLSIKVTIV